MRRAGRTPAAPAGVAVVGAGSGLGLALVQRLVRRDDVDPVVGVDAVPGRVDGVVWRSADPMRPGLAGALAGAGTLVHCALSYDPSAPAAERRERAVRTTEAVLAAADRVGAARVVLVTSAEVVAGDGVRPESGPLRDDCDEGLLGDLLEVERLAAASSVPVAVVRPAALVGAGLGDAYDSALVRQLAAPRLLTVRGAEPRWQLCHADDLLAALEAVVASGAVGPFGVGCDGWLAQGAVEVLAGRPRLELPAAVALGTAARLHRLGAGVSPAELQQVLSPAVIALDRALGLGWRPGWTNEAVVKAYVAARSGDGLVGARTAAGATVALLGTAALVRRARRRRGR